MKKKFKKIFPLLIALTIVLMPFGGLKAFAYSGGLLSFETIQEGSSLSDAYVTTTTVTDNNESTSRLIGNATSRERNFYFQFNKPRNITDYQIKTSVPSSSIRLALYDKNKTLITAVNNLNTDGVKTSIPSVSNVTFVSFEYVGTDTTNPSSGYIYEMDVFGTDSTGYSANSFYSIYKDVGYWSSSYSGSWSYLSSTTYPFNGDITAKTPGNYIQFSVKASNINIYHYKYGSTTGTGLVYVDGVYYGSFTTLSDTGNNDVTAMYPINGLSNSTHVIKIVVDTQTVGTKTGSTVALFGISYNALNYNDISSLNSSVNNNNVTLNYSIPSNNTNFTGSKIYRDGVLIKTQNATTNSFTDSGLNWGTNYTYKVTATYSDGYETQGITTTATIPTEPDSPGVGSLDYTTNYNSISFSWENPSDISGVNIYRDGNLIKTLAATETSYTDSNLTPETAYTYKFTVTYSDGRKSEEKTIKATTTAEPEPVLSGVDYSQNGSGEYVFTWTEPTQGQVKVLIDKQEYKTVDAALKQVTIPKEDMKTDNLGNPLVSMVPMSLSGKVGETKEVKGKNVEIPFNVNDLMLSGTSLLWYVAPFLLLALAFLFVPKLRNLVFAAFKGTKEEKAAAKEKRAAAKEKRRAEKQERQREVRERATARETREPREKIAKEERKPRETRESRIQREPRETRERRN